MRAVTKRGSPEAETNLREVIAALDPCERERVLRLYITQLGVDAMDSRSRGWYDQANFLEELAHHMRLGHVIMAGDLKGLEYLLNVEASRVRDEQANVVAEATEETRSRIERGARRTKHRFEV